MVRTSVIIAMVVTLFISLFLPIIIYITYGVKNKGKGVWLAWLLGAAGFFVPQILIRLPILSVLSLSQGFVAFAEGHYVLYCLALAFTAGLFEVAGRYAVAKIMAKNLSFEKSVAAGLGHGGIEAMLIVGITYIFNLIYVWMINSGIFRMVSGINGWVAIPPEDMAVYQESMLAVQEILTGSGPVIYYLAGYERILTMIFHVAMSLLVCYFVWKGKGIKGILICLALHTAADFVTPLLNGLATSYLGSVVSQNTAYVLVYLYLTAIAVGSVVFIIKMRKRWN